MSITSTIITSTSVLRGKTNAQANALPVFSEDYNKVVADLTSIDTRLTDLEDGTVDLVDLNLSGNLVVTGDTTSTAITLADGTVSDLAVKIGADSNNGLYGVSDTQLGIAVEGVLVGMFDTAGLKVASIGEQVTDAGISILSIVNLSQTAQTLTGAGAVDIITQTTLVVTTAADALTLADGTDGQIKVIIMKTDGGDGTLTPTSLNGGTTITFSAVGQTATLLFKDSKWNVIGLVGAVLA